MEPEPLNLHDALFQPQQLDVYLFMGFHRQSVLTCALLGCNCGFLLDCTLDQLFRDILTIQQPRYHIPEIIPLFFKDKITEPIVYERNKNLWDDLCSIYGSVTLLERLLPYRQVIHTIVTQICSTFLAGIVRELDQMQRQRDLAMLRLSCYKGSLGMLPLSMILREVGTYL